MDWKGEAVEKLRQLGAMETALTTIPLEMERLELDAQKIRTSDPGKVMKQGGGRQEDALLSNIVHRQELSNRLQQAGCWVDMVKKALSALSDQEQVILRRLYVERQKGAVDRLCFDLGMEQSTVYRHRDQALRQFTMALYGV